MKRLGSSDSMGALMSICPTSTDDHNQGNNHVYHPREFQSMLEGLDEEGCVEESGHIPEKKRRLSVDQVKALEKNFEVENKLEPDRKVKLAQELGLQPRQVAVWFQNRRARWKTKQLERDYSVLKANYDALKHKYDNLQHDNEALVKEIRELKSQLQDDKSEGKVSVKVETMVSEGGDDKVMDDHQAKESILNDVLAECDDDDDATEFNFESFNSSNGGGVMGSALIFADFKDGSSDSDSSAILNEDNLNNICSPNAAISSSGGGEGVVLQTLVPHQFLISNGGGGSSSSSMSTGFQFGGESKSAILGEAQKASSYQPQIVKIEEHNFFSGDEPCSTFFSDDQPPTLHWYCPEEWN